MARYHGPGNGDHGAGATALDTAGNVYVTGSSQGTDYYVTVKYFAAVDR